MRTLVLMIALLAVCAAGCGSSKARVKGQVVENGKPVTVEAQAALMFDLIGPDGKTDTLRSYPVPLNKDGSFELAASGGEVVPGTYKVTLQVNGPKGSSGITLYKGQSLKQEIRAGSNVLSVELTKMAP
ncbi:MAG: hypothetical protein U0840_09300 [Gemmataceae bacterium]